MDEGLVLKASSGVKVVGGSNPSSTAKYVGESPVKEETVF